MTALLLANTGCKREAPREVRIGGIFDMTGATRDISVPYADGIRWYIDYINSKGA